MIKLLHSPAGLILSFTLGLAAIIFAALALVGPGSNQLERCAKIENTEKSVACFNALDK